MHVSSSVQPGCEAFRHFRSQPPSNLQENPVQRHALRNPVDITTFMLNWMIDVFEREILLTGLRDNIYSSTLSSSPASFTNS